MERSSNFLPRRRFMLLGIAALAVAAFSFALLQGHRSEHFNGKPVSYWIKQLDNSTDEAIQIWVPFGTHAIPHLIRALQKGPSTERAYAALHGLLPSPLQSKLPDPTRRNVIRSNAAHVLADFGPEAKAAVPALTVALSDPLLKQNAANALGEMGPSARSAVPRLLTGLDDPKIRNNCLNALSKIGIESPKAIKTMIDLYADCSDDDKRRALRVLGTVASTNVEVDRVFRDALRSESTNLRIAAVSAAGNRGPAGASLIPAILDSISSSDRNSTLEFQVIWAFSKIGSEAVDALPYLKEKLNAGAEFSRLIAADSIWKIQPGDADAESVMLESLKSSERGVAHWAAKLLLPRISEIDGARSRLLDLKRSDDQLLKQFAAVASWLNETSSPPPIEPLLRFVETPLKSSGGEIYLTPYSIAFELFEYFGASARDAVPRLKKLRASRNEFIRRFAARALAAIERKRSTNHITHP